MRKPRKIVLLSDIEICMGDKFDDFPHTDYLADFILRYKEHPAELDLIFNGDTFDFLKTPVKDSFPHLVDEQIALQKLENISNAHLRFFESIGELIAESSHSRRVYFIVGNHDMELLFPQVQNQIVKLCGGSGQIHFPGFYLTIGDLYIEHGNQQDSLFRVEPEAAFVDYKDKKILNLPWTSVTLLNAILPHRNEFHELDRIKPRDVVFEKIPPLKEFLLTTLWKYWRNDYLSNKDPLKRISWGMLKEAFKRSFFFNPDVEVSNNYYERITQRGFYSTYVIGHLHEPKLLSFGNRRFIQSGCFRDEFMLNQDGSFSPIAKSYIEIDMVDNKVVSTALLEDAGLEMPRHRIPRSLESHIPILNEILGSQESRKVNQEDMKAHEQGRKYKDH